MADPTMIVCAWCNRQIFHNPDGTDSVGNVIPKETQNQIGNVSHGICPECLKKEMDKMKAMKAPQAQPPPAQTGYESFYNWLDRKIVEYGEPYWSQRRKQFDMAAKGHKGVVKDIPPTYSKPTMPAPLHPKPQQKL